MAAAMAVRIMVRVGVLAWRGIEQMAKVRSGKGDAARGKGRRRWRKRVRKVNGKEEARRCASEVMHRGLGEAVTEAGAGE